MLLTESHACWGYNHMVCNKLMYSAFYSFILYYLAWLHLHSTGLQPKLCKTHKTKSIFLFKWRTTLVIAFSADKWQWIIWCHFPLTSIGQIMGYVLSFRVSSYTYKCAAGRKIAQPTWVCNSVFSENPWWWIEAWGFSLNVFGYWQTEI